MKLEFLTGAELSRYTGVSRAAITQATREGRLYKDPKTGRYDPTHATNLAFINQNRLKSATIAEIEDEGDDNLPDVSPGTIPESLQELYARKLKAEADRAERQAIKLGLELDQKRGKLILRSDVAMAFGAFRFGLQTYFLQLGNRIARGDIKLRDRIEKEVTKSIEKTIGNAEAEVLRLSKIKLED